MSTPPEADSDSVNGQLAEFLCSRKEEMIRSWIGRIQADPAIPAESLTTNQLRDNLPRLFDDLADTILRYGSDEVANRTARDAEKHGAERWQQGFELPQLLREIMHLRAVFIYHLRIFEEQHAGFGTPRSSTRIRRCINSSTSSPSTRRCSSSARTGTRGARVLGSRSRLVAVPARARIRSGAEGVALANLRRVCCFSRVRTGRRLRIGRGAQEPRRRVGRLKNMPVMLEHGCELTAIDHFATTRAAVT
jgi:hypothetical protein